MIISSSKYSWKHLISASLLYPSLSTDNLTTVHCRANLLLVILWHWSFARQITPVGTVHILLSVLCCLSM